MGPSYYGMAGCVAIPASNNCTSAVVGTCWKSRMALGSGDYVGGLTSSAGDTNGSFMNTQQPLAFTF